MSSFTSTSVRLQHAYNQYESLLIRAGEIIDHVPNAHDSLDNSFEGSDMDHMQFRSTVHIEKSSNIPQANMTDLKKKLQSSNTHLMTSLPTFDSTTASLTNHFNAIPIMSSPNIHMRDVQQSSNPFGSNINKSLHNSAVTNNINKSSYGNNNQTQPISIDVPDDEKVNIILTLQSEVNRLKDKLDQTINSAEETISTLYQAHSNSELQHRNINSQLTVDNTRLIEENDMLKKKLKDSQLQLEIEKQNLFKATHYIHRLHSRQKIITHGLLPNTIKFKKEVKEDGYKKSKRSVASTMGSSADARVPLSRSSTGNSFAERNRSRSFSKKQS